MSWTQVSNLIAFLKPIYGLTKDLSSEKNCTISMVCIMVSKLLQHSSINYEDEILNGASESLRTKLLAHIDRMYQPIAVIAIVLDPRFKVNICLKRRKNMPSNRSRS